MVLALPQILRRERRGLRLHWALPLLSPASGTSDSCFMNCLPVLGTVLLLPVLGLSPRWPWGEVRTEVRAEAVTLTVFSLPAGAHLILFFFFFFWHRERITPQTEWFF